MVRIRGVPASELLNGSWRGGKRVEEGVLAKE